MSHNHEANSCTCHDNECHCHYHDEQTHEHANVSNCNGDCCSCHSHDDNGCGCGHCHSDKPIKNRLLMLIPAAIVLVLSFIFSEDLIWVSILLLAAYIIVGLDTVINAVTELIREKTVGESFLMSIATFGAIAVGELREAVAVMVFYSIGQILEEVAQNRSKKSIRALMELHPDVVHIKRDGKIVPVTPEEVNAGDIIMAVAGERISLDGKILSGTTSIDYSALTGESIPVYAAEGDNVFGGGINLNGSIEIEVTKPYAESSAARVIRLVEDARSKKAKSERFIARFAKKYTVAVCIIAALIAFIFPIFTGYADTFSRWLYTGLTFLVVSCPCALVISVPLTFFAGLGCASSHGILIKSTASVETISKLKTIAFDKTGTITKGVLSVTHTELDDESLRFAAYAESRSNHPAAKAIVSYFGEDIPLDAITETEEIPGRGIKATVLNKEVLVGNRQMMIDNGIREDDLKQRHAFGIYSYVLVDGELKGHIILNDELKSDSIDAIDKLHKFGVEAVMLTGDNQEAANEVCNRVRIISNYANLSPEQKCLRMMSITQFAKSNQGGTAAFVGDGINDAPVLAMADVGIAMGGLGSDAAIETADAVILNDSLMKLPLLIKISKRTMSIVKQNIVFSLGVKILVMILSVLNIATMWMAVFADIGVMLLAVLNALRALRYRKRD